MNRIAKTIVSLILIVVIAVGTVIGNWAVNQFENEIGTVLSPAIVDEESMEVSSAQGQALQYSCLENPMDGGAWWAAVHGVEKSQTRLSDFTCTFHFPALEKEMATHSSVLAWRIPGTVEPGGLPSMGLHRVGHD